MSLTPEPKRSALFAVYAWMRAADDAADAACGNGEAVPANRLAAFREATDAALASAAPPEDAESFWPAFVRAVRKYEIERDWLNEQLAGQADDLAAVDMPSFAALSLYCDRVAGSVGRCCVSVWGHDGDDAVPGLVASRGRALQLTNIVRDVAEDAARGRVYLPRDERERFGCRGNDWTSSAGFADLMGFQIERARSFYAASCDLESHLHPDGRRASWALMETYRRLLERIARDPEGVRQARVSLPWSAKAAVVLRACAGPRPGSAVGPVGRGGVVKGQTRHVAVLGGGVAGIAAAVRLADAGARVTLLEMSPRLGGRATSRPDPKAGGGDLDNCQHVVMRCCTEILDLYDTLGVGGQIHWHDQFFFVHADGTRDTLRRGVLPAPLHLAGSFLRWRGLGWRDKLSIARTLGRMRRVAAAERRTAERPDLRRVAGAAAPRAHAAGARKVLGAHGGERVQPPAAASVAAGYAIQVFVDGMMAGRRGYEMGLSDVPLARLYDPAAKRIAQAAGGRVRFGRG